MIKLIIFSGVPIDDSATFYRAGQLAKYLNPRLFSVTFLSVSNNYKKNQTLKINNDLNVTFIGQAHYIAKENFSNRQRLSVPVNLLKNMQTITSFLKILLKEKPDRVLVVTTMPIALMCGLISKLFGFKTLIDIEDYALGQMVASGYPPIFIKIFGFIEKKVLNSFNKIIVCSEFLKDIYPKSIVIPNMVNLKIWDKKKLSKNKNIAFVGYMGKYHGQKKFIEAINRNLINKKYKLYLIGAGEQEESLKKVVKKLKIGKNIIFTGQLYQQEVSEVLRKCCIGVLPLWDQPVHQARHPLKLIEYLAAGLIAITNNVGEAQRLIKDGENGYLCPAGDIEALAKKSIEILGQQINPKTIINSKKTAEKFAIDKIIPLWEKAIAKC